MTKEKAKLTVLLLLVLCMLPGLGLCDSKAALDSAVKDTKLYSKWQSEHKKVCDLMGKYKFAEALEASKPLMGYLKELNLTESKEMFETCNNIGAIYLHLQHFQQAHNLFWTAMKIGNKLYGSDSLEVGIVFKNLSQLYGDRATQIFLLHKEELGIPETPDKKK